MGNEVANFTFEPKTLDEALKYCELLSKSTLVPKDYQGQAGNILVAIQWGQEIGLKPLQALQNIACINGRPCLWGDALLAMVRASGLIEDFREDFHEQSFTATCTAKRKGQPTPIIRTFSKADAEKAGLWDRNTWKSYPKRMAQMRARAFALRDGFTDVVKGMPIAEEQLDVDTSEALAAPNLPDMPKRLSQAQLVAMPENKEVDPVGEWVEAIKLSENLNDLKVKWARVAPATMDGMYHTLPPAQQARLVLAKDTRKAELEAAEPAGGS
jgi:hypothetical protein